MRLLGLLFLITGLVSCKDESTNSGNTPPPSLTARVGGCVGLDGLRGSALDSVFTYSFYQNLDMSFSIIADCCSDSSRFAVSQGLSGDTIIISIAHNAISYCNCICPRMVQAELTNLTGDHYIVRCQMDQGFGPTNPIHLVTIHRTPNWTAPD